LGRILRGFGANAYGQVVVAIIQLAGVPILLHYWGARLYGEWLILSAIPSYLSMTDLGFSQSAANDMTARVGRGDRNGALAVFQSLTALVYTAAVVGLLLVALLAIFLPVGEWLHISELSPLKIRWILWLLAAEVLVKLAEGSSHAGFRASGEYAFHTSIYYTTLFAQQVVVWCAVTTGHGPLVAAALFMAVRVVVTPSVAALLFWRHRYLKPGFANASLVELRALVRPALANVAMPLAQAFNIQGLVLVVGAVLGPVAVVVFSTLRTLTRLTLQLVVSVSHAVEPELARAWGAGDRSLMRRMYVHSMRASFWMALVAAVALHFLGDVIVTLWTHGKVAMDIALFDLLLLSAAASMLWYGGLSLLKAGNRHLGAAVLYVLASLAAVVMATLLLRVTGKLSDVGFALLLMDAMMATYLLRKASALVRMSVLGLLAQIANPWPFMRGVWRRVSNVY